MPSSSTRVTDTKNRALISFILSLSLFSGELHSSESQAKLDNQSQLETLLDSQLS